jgi:hypothetical protein
MASGVCSQVTSHFYLSQRRCQEGKSGDSQTSTTLVSEVHWNHDTYTKCTVVERWAELGERRNADKIRKDERISSCGLCDICIFM